MEPKVTRDILASPSRRAVYEAIVGSAGISVSDIARQSGLYWTLAAFHVHRLSRSGLVRSVKVGRRRLMFVPTRNNEAWALERGMLAEPACLRVALAVIQYPGQRVLDLHYLTGVSERAIYHHMKRLLAVGLVTSRKTRYYLGMQATQKLLTIVAEIRQPPPP